MSILNKLFVGIFCIVFITNACRKNDELGWVNATVVDLGDPEVDGCGIKIEIENVLYAPTEYDDQLFKDKQKIKIKYILLDDYYPCGFSTMEKMFQKIEIIKIKPR